MNINTCIKEVEKLKGYGLPVLVVRIGEIYEKHEEGKRLTDKEKFIIGLRYSEFLSESNDEIDLHNAEIKRKAMLKDLDIEYNDLVDMCREQLNLH